MKDRAKGLSEIARLLNRDDTPNIQYSIRKLLKAGLIEKASATSRKGTSYRVTDHGRAVTDSYADLRARVLLPFLRSIGRCAEDQAAAEQFLNLMTGMYDQAAKQAAEQRY
jgi:predicted MarR family transcription regulator